MAKKKTGNENSQENPENEGTRYVQNHFTAQNQNIFILIVAAVFCDGVLAFLFDAVVTFLDRHEHPLMADWCSYIEVPLLLAPIAAIAHRFWPRAIRLIFIWATCSIIVDVFLYSFREANPQIPGFAWTIIEGVESMSQTKYRWLMIAIGIFVTTFVWMILIAAIRRHGGTLLAAVTKDLTTFAASGGAESHATTTTTDKQTTTFRPKMVFRSIVARVIAGSNSQDISLDQDGNAEQRFAYSVGGPAEIIFRVKQRVIHVNATITDGTDIVNMHDLPNGDIALDFRPPDWQIRQDENALEVIAKKGPIFQVRYKNDTVISITGAFPAVNMKAPPGADLPVMVILDEFIASLPMSAIRTNGIGLHPIFDSEPQKSKKM
jgi:hypothetical protein